MSKSSTIIKPAKTSPDFSPAHPGDVLLEDFLKPLELTQYALAKALGVAQLRISEICRGKRAVSADTALRLSRYFGTTPEFWLGMQASYDLAIARAEVGDKMEEAVTPIPHYASQ